MGPTDVIPQSGASLGWLIDIRSKADQNSCGLRHLALMSTLIPSLMGQLIADVRPPTILRRSYPSKFLAFLLFLKPKNSRASRRKEATSHCPTGPDPTPQVRPCNSHHLKTDRETAHKSKQKRSNRVDCLKSLWKTRRSEAVGIAALFCPQI